MAAESPVLRKLQSDAVKRAASNFLGMHNFSWIALASSMGFFWAAGWIPDAITNLALEDGKHLIGLTQLGFSLCVFSFFGWQINRKIEEVEKIRVDVTEPQKAKVLVVFLSSIPRQQDRDKLFNTACDASEIPALLAGTSWEMPYLATLYHMPRLEHLHVITSGGSNGTCLQFGYFAAIINKLFPGLKVTQMDEQGLNFEDIAQVHKAIDKFYDQYDNRPDFAKHDVIVDITGGQKTNSIAAAMATLADGRKFQYVSTTTKKVESFDLIIAG